MAYKEERQLFVLALPGVITEMNGAHHDELGSWGKNEHTIPWCTNTLRDFYGVEDQASFDETVEWLTGDGHSQGARDAIATLGPPHLDGPKQVIVRANAQEIQRVGLLAWDLGRAAAVIGWGFWAGFVTEAKAWEMLFLAGNRVQKAYDSWQAYGKAYELGRMVWAEGKRHDKTDLAMAKLLSLPTSPWRTVPWNANLGSSTASHGVGAGGAKQRFKKSTCPTCGATKSRPSKTGFVYCDHCGALSDYDFQRACDIRPDLRPGPAYESMLAQIQPSLDTCKMQGNVDGYRHWQRQLFTAFCEHVPLSCPPRAGDPEYRARWVAYMAEAATVIAFDARAAQYDGAVANSTRTLQFYQPRPGVMRVQPQAFQAMASAVFAQLDYHDHVYQQHGIYDLHPDRASRELQRKVGFSLFVQGWLAMLEEAMALDLIARTGLGAEYIEADPPKGDLAGCGCCGAPVTVLEGARVIVCEKCGHRLEVGAARLSCRGCGSPLAPAEGKTRFNCPHCKVELTRVA